MNFLSYFAVKYVQQLENISKSSKYCLGHILKGQKVLNDRMNLENNKATPSRKFSTQEGLALVAAFGQTLQIFQDTIVSQFAKETSAQRKPNLI